MPKHEPVTVRVTLANGLMIDRLVPWADRQAALKRLEKACDVLNDHLDFEALVAESVEV
jgi:hypothetical protein